MPQCRAAEREPVCGAESPGLAAAAGRGDVAHRLVCLLEVLRGATRGASYAAQAPVYGALEAVQVGFGA